MRSLTTSVVALALAAATALAAPAIRATPKAADFFVDGSKIPGISNQTGPLGDSYAGLLPISKTPDDDRKFFFWWWPTSGDVGKDDLVIWLNGGPGCSSLEGMLEENGPFSISSPEQGVVKAKVNPYSWHKLSNVLWIEQPVGVGLGSGKPDITNEHGVAKEFYGFLQNFFDTFTDLKGKKLWITGESYAGMYVPYIVDYIYKQDDTLNLQGFAVNDPSIVNDKFGEDIPAYQFALDNKDALGLNGTFISQLKTLAKKKGVADYLEKTLTFPPKGVIQPPKQLQEGDIWNPVYYAAADANKCFSVYLIDNKCPTPIDPLGFALDQDTTASKNNFINNEPGFKEFVHAKAGRTWLECTNENVFLGQGDTSEAPTDIGLLGTIIDKSKRSVVQHGLRDFILLANGSLLGIQNSTWGGKQGFQTSFFQSPDNLIVDGKPAGTVHSERNFTFATVNDAGHMIPEFTPAVAYKLQQFLLGQIEESDLTQ